MAMDLSGMPVIDHHVHALRRTHPADAIAYRSAFTESGDPAQLRDHVPHSAYYRWLLREAASVLGCAPTEDAVLEARRRYATPADLARVLWPRANISAMLFDTGFLRKEMLSPADMEQATGIRSFEVVRLETLAEDLIAESRSFDELRERWRAAVAAFREQGVVAAKSIAAYRTGLAILRVPAETAAAAFRPGRRRLASKPLLDFLLWEAFPLLAAQELPIQFHVGYGDADADQRLANPLHLRAVLQEPALAAMPIVLLHCYPYIREAGILAATHAQVALDCSLIIPLGLAGATRYLSEALELAPATKVLYASDAHSWPEGHWLAARVYRQALGDALAAAHRAGYLSAGEAEDDAAAVLAGNARRIYGVRDAQTGV
jgi:predicted TIM-barrel fold metal-dependent hydrolase